MFQDELPFIITPYLVDHSAYDAFAIQIEADGKKLFYSGDFRGHGRKRKLLDNLVTHPPEKIDTLLMEGTTLSITKNISRTNDLLNDLALEFNTNISIFFLVFHLRTYALQLHPFGANRH